METSTQAALTPLLVDIDSTLYDSTPILLRYMLQLHGVDLDPSEYRDWDFWREFISRDEFDVLIDEHFHDPSEIAAAKPYRGAVRTLNAWRAEGHPLHIVSDRDTSKGGPTMDWLDKIGLRYDAFFIGHKIDKIGYALAMGIRLAIDDNPNFIERAIAAGIVPATLAMTYNYDVIARHPGDVIVAPNWTKLREQIIASGALDLMAGPSSVEVPFERRLHRRRKTD